MSYAEPHALQAIATAAWGTAGVVTLRGADSRTDGTLGWGLLIGALLVGFDTLTLGATAMPLAGWALLALGTLALAPNPASAWHALGSTGWRRSLAALATFALLHALHGIAPLQPMLDWGIRFLPLDLLAALALGWVAWRKPASECVADSLLTDAQRRVLLGGTATGLAIAAFGGSSAGDIVAMFQIGAVAPLLWPPSQANDRIVNTTAATAIAATMALVLRASCMAPPLGEHDAWLASGLGAIAAMFLCFGLAAAMPAPDPMSGRSPVAPASPPEPREPAPSLGPAPMSMHALGVDLRGPITTMLAAADLLGHAPSPGDRADHLSTIHRQGRQLAASLADLEDFERLLRGDLEFAADTFELRELLRCSSEEATSVAARRGIEVRLDFASQLPEWVQGDPSRLRQLTSRMLDLVVNRANIGPIDLSASAHGDMIDIVVQSQDPSLPLGQSTDDSTANSTFQAGIGLAFSRQLAQALGGDLEVHDRPRGGVTMHLTLPLVLPPAWEIEIAQQDAARPEGPGEPPRKVSGRVLLVDDSRDHQRLIGHLVTRTGATVLTADSGDIALLMLQEQPFDLVLMDLQMPGTDGLQTTAELRRRGITTPVLAITADNGEEATTRCLAAGCNGHLEKPVDNELLQRMLAMYLPAATVS